MDLQSLAAATAGALTARLATHPLDTLRIRWQTAPLGSQLSLGSLLRPYSTLYRGLPVALVFSVPALSLYLSVYEGMKRTLARNGGLREGFASYILAGATAEIVSGAIWTPMEVLKARLQRGGSGDASETVALARQIITQEGWQGLWRGYLVTLGTFIPYTCIYFSIFEHLKAQAALDNLSLAASAPRIALCSAMACAVAAAVSNVNDVVQSRWQTSGGQAATLPASASLPSSNPSTPWSIVKELYRQDGFRAFTRGMGARVLWMVPANSISMTIFQSLKA